MASIPRIIWVQDEYNGPMNGLVEYNGEKLWFSRQTEPKFISSTGDVVPPVTVDSEEDNREKYNNRLYTLFRIKPEEMELVTSNHNRYCEETGAPVNHGDPVKIRRRPMIKRPESELVKALDPANKDTRPAVDVAINMRGLANVKRFDHQIIPSNITGDVIVVVKEREFSNYSVPRTFEVVEQ